MQELTSALAALGLGTDDIPRADNIASLIKDFNPTIFTSLIYQLKAQAQQTCWQDSAPAVNPANS